MYTRLLKMINDYDSNYSYIDHISNHYNPMSDTKVLKMDISAQAHHPPWVCIDVNTHCNCWNIMDVLSQREDTAFYNDPFTGICPR